MSSIGKDITASVLVTGSTGFLGSCLVEHLIAKKFRIRAFVRESSNLENLKRLGVEISIGDIADLASLRTACRGIDYVIHAAADTIGSARGGKRNTILGTKNIVAVCKEYSVKKLVYVSSCSVYGVADYNKGETITEKSSLEIKPDARGAYSNAKFLAEKVILEAIEEKLISIVCLRPGTIYGPKGKIFTPMMGFSYKTRLFFTIGNGQFVLPLVYIDNVADAIIKALEKEESTGKIYNIIDPYQITKKQYNLRLVKKIFPNAKFFYIPYFLLYILVFIQEILFKLINKKPLLTRYRLKSSQKVVLYSGKKIHEELGWTPPVSLDKALDNCIEHELTNR